MTPKYRADIDGLRAVAVLSIVLFHLGVDAFGGGYVGVDIFFVISGFLITSIIVRELADGSFTIARFYERRVRRILPALIVVLVATLLVGLVMLRPAQLGELAKSAIATSFFSSNFYFHSLSGYFDGPSEAKPLLHTWSLAVEEQYYILFPLLLILLKRRLNGRYRLPVVVLSVLSLGACVVTTGISETTAFFLIPFRAWELLLGSLLALGTVPPVRTYASRNLLAVGGLVLVLTSVFLFTASTPFPGAAALLPTLGTAAVIHAGSAGPNAIGRALSVRPMVFIGLISYSLYLWHWPVVVYAKQYLINEPTDAEKGMMFLAALVLATLSWKYVEAPFRDRRRFAPRARLFAGAGAVSLLVVVAAAGLVLAGGLPGRNLPEGMSGIVAADPGWQHWKDCEELGEDNNRNPELCDIGLEGVDPSFMLWGDSHALALASAVNLTAADAAEGGLIAVRTGCPPLLGIAREGRASCVEFNRAILSRLQAEDGIRTVVLAARWTLAADGERYKNEPGRAVVLTDFEASPDMPADNASLFERGLGRTLDALEQAGKTVVLVGQVPEIGLDVPASNYSARLTGRDVNQMIAPSIDEFDQRTRTARSVLDRVLSGRNVRRIEPASRLCDEQRCAVAVDGVPLYRDDNHLSLRGNVLIADLFDSVFEPGAE
jgi:peptidoglycan/LPS O-acetylase OafA/YrhL